VKRRHEARGDTEADKTSSQHQAERALGTREDEGAGGGEEQKKALRASGAEPIEGDAHRDLADREREKIGAGEQTHGPGIERELADEVRRDDGVDRAEPLRKEVTDGEGKKGAAKEHASIAS